MEMRNSIYSENQKMFATFVVCCRGGCKKTHETIAQMVHYKLMELEQFQCYTARDLSGLQKRLVTIKEFRLWWK